MLHHGLQHDNKSVRDREGRGERLLSHPEAGECGNGCDGGSMIQRLLLLLLLFSPVLVRAQTTTTGTIVDPQGNPYSNGTASAQKSVSTGQVQPPPVNVTTNGSGTFSMTLPSPASYIFTICAPPTQIGPTGNPTPISVCFSNVTPISISGGSQDISSSLNAIAKVLGPNITGVSGVVANCTANQVPFYAVNGNVVACSSVITISGSTATIQNEIVTGTLNVGTTATITGALAANGGATVNNGLVVNGGSTLNGGGSDAGSWTHAGNHTFNGAANRANGALTSTSRFSANNLNDMLIVDGITYTTIAAAVTAAGTTNPNIILIPSTYSGTECPAIQNNLVFWDFRAGGRSGGGTSSFICPQNVVQYNTKTPGLTDAMLRPEMTRTAVDATGSILVLYPITHLKNATVTAGVVDGVSPECDVEGTLSGTLTSCQGSENVAFITSTGGTVSNASGGIGYVTDSVGRTTAIGTVRGFWGRGCVSITGPAPPNCYGLYADEQSAASGQNYALAGKGFNVAKYSTSQLAAGWDLEDAAQVAHHAFYSASDNSTNLQAINAIGTNLNDVGGVTRANITSSGLKINSVNNGQGLQLLNSATTCTTGAAIGATCTTASIALPVAYSDTAYRLVCTGLGPTAAPIVETVTKSNGSFTITVAALTAVAASFSSFDCMVAHN